jgi:hypothetical protein
MAGASAIALGIDNVKELALKVAAIMTGVQVE